VWARHVLRLRSRVWLVQCVLRCLRSVYRRHENGNDELCRFFEVLGARLSLVYIWQGCPWRLSLVSKHIMGQGVPWLVLYMFGSKRKAYVWSMRDWLVVLCRCGAGVRLILKLLPLRQERASERIYILFFDIAVPLWEAAYVPFGRDQADRSSFYKGLARQASVYLFIYFFYFFLSFGFSSSNVSDLRSSMNGESVCHPWWEVRRHLVSRLWI